MANSIQKSLVLENFKYGLDSRRDALSLVPGTLLTAQDGHINPGGQFEKRKAFVRDATGAYPNYSFGLQDTDSGLITFGSLPLTIPIKTRQRAANVAVLTLNTPYPPNQFLQAGMQVTISGLTNAVAGNYNGTYVITLVGPHDFRYANVGTNEGVTNSDGNCAWSNATVLPVGVGYQVLEPPNGNTEALNIFMTELVYSDNFLGKAFAIARFNNGSVFCYYDGDIIAPSRNGRVIILSTGNETISDLSQDLADQINNLAATNDSYLGWRAVANKNALTQANQTGTALAGSTLVMSPGGVHFIPTVSKDSDNGLIGAKLIDQDYPGVPETAAKASFTITGGAGGDTIQVSAPQNADGTGTVDLTNGAISYNTSLHQTAVDVVTAINNNTYLTGYTAANSSGADITVIAPDGFGAFTYNLSVTTTGTMTVAAFVGTVLPTFAIKMQFSTVISHPQTGQTTQYASNKAIVSGAPGPVTYTWHEVSNPNGILCSTKLDTPLSANTIYFSLPGVISGGTTGSVGDTNNRTHGTVIPATGQGVWRCTANSGALPPVSVDFTIIFQGS